MSARAFFDQSWKRLKGTTPYPWQAKLFEQVVSGDWPEVVDMPTGSGKTALLWIWWLALAWTRQEKTGHVPIRLAWVVNRRVVVDQVTAEIEELCSKWRELEFEPLRDPPAVSTLRGGLADKGAWMRDPALPAVVVGTVDMIGSRLLFRGYRSGPYWRPIEAGLLGVDALIVNDESHLSPAFAKLLQTLETMRPAERISGKSFRYLLLSATQGQDFGGRRFEHNPEQDGAQNDAFRNVWTARKRLELIDVANRAVLEAQMWKLATEQPAARTIVFVNQPKEALKFWRRLDEKGFRAVLMTGTMRGWERDQLVKDPVFQLFQQKDPDAQPAFFVATSAAEVGVNLTCERLITELCEADHLVQRFGRLNRFGADTTGARIEGEAVVLYVQPKKDSLEATLAYLKHLDCDVSPRALWTNRPNENACAERPKVARLERWRIENWAQTSFRDRELNQPVETWLSGKQEEIPHTEIVWRADLQYLLDWEAPKSDIESAVEQTLDAFPALAEERLQEPSDQVLQNLKIVAEKLSGRPDRVVVVDTDRSVAIKRIEELSKEGIRNRMLLLPAHIGRVGRHGMFDPEVADEATPDIATKNGQRIRLLYRQGSFDFIGEHFGATPAGTSRSAITQFAKDNGFRAPVIIRNPDEEDEILIYLNTPSEARKRELREIALEEHQPQVASRAQDLAVRSGLGSDLAAQYHTAGLLHDDGKAHELWQRAMGARGPRAAAKTMAAANPALLNGYRHEFGSLLKASDEHDDFVLHLIATHHAAGRPFFKERNFDPWKSEEESADVARECEQRFARLQDRFGPWGLAYLEAIFKRADGQISAEEGDGASE